MKAVILAAGVGKRLWQVTQHRPKCLIELGGQSLLRRYLATLGQPGYQTDGHRRRIQAGDDSRGSGGLMLAASK